MSGLAKEDAPVKKIAVRTYRFWYIVRMMLLIGSIVHAFYALFFYANGLADLAAVNGAATLLWFILFLLNQKQHSYLSFTAASVLLIIATAVNSIRLGWNSGFFVLFLPLIPIIFLNDHARAPVKWLYSVFFTLAAIAIRLCQFMNVMPLVDAFNPWLLQFINLVVCIFCLALFGHYYNRSSSAIEEDLKMINKKLEYLAITDPLTNLLNRRQIMDRIEIERARVERGGKPFTLVMIDMDNLKSINDTYGHAAGDFVLVSIAEVMRLTLRRQDQIARWGGDEFLLVLPDTNLLEGGKTAEKIRSRIARQPFIFNEKDMRTSITLGVCECDRVTGINDCLRKVDQALYMGKRQGRNCVVMCTQDNPNPELQPPLYKDLM